MANKTATLTTIESIAARLEKIDLNERRRAGDRTAYTKDELELLDRHTAQIETDMKLIGTVHTEARRHEFETMRNSMIERKMLEIAKNG